MTADTPPAYLTVRETAQLLQLSDATVRRRVRAGELACLQFTPRLWRIEAAGLVPKARDPIPPGPARVDVAWLAELWRLNPKTIHRLARDGAIPAERHRGQWTIRRRALYRLVVDLTTGQHEEPLCPPHSLST